MTLQRTNHGDFAHENRICRETERKSCNYVIIIIHLDPFIRCKNFTPPLKIHSSIFSKSMMPVGLRPFDVPLPRLRSANFSEPPLYRSHQGAHDRTAHRTTTAAPKVRRAARDQTPNAGRVLHDRPRPQKACGFSSRTWRVAEGLISCGHHCQKRRGACPRARAFAVPKQTSCRTCAPRPVGTI